MSYIVEGKDLTANQGTVTTVLLECKNCLENEEHTYRSIYARRVSRVCEPHDTDHITLLQYYQEVRSVLDNIYMRICLAHSHVTDQGLPIQQ